MGRLAVMVGSNKALTDFTIALDEVWLILLKEPMNVLRSFLAQDCTHELVLLQKIKDLILRVDLIHAV